MLGRSRAKEMATDVLARAHAGTRDNAVIESVAQAERTEQTLRRAADTPRYTRRPPVPEVAVELAAAEARLAETQRRLEQTPWWRRGERQRLNEQLAQQFRAVMHWHPQQATTANTQPKHSRAATTHAAGHERLNAQMTDRAALIELLTEPPRSINFESPTFDTGLDL